MRKNHDITDKAVEARLGARFAIALSHGHRDRVLAAVEDALHVRAVYPDTGTTISSMAPLVAMALSAVVALIMPWIVFATANGLPTTVAVVALRAGAAGMHTPPELILAATHTPNPLRSDTSAPLLGQRHEAWQIRRNLSGEL